MSSCGLLTQPGWGHWANSVVRRRAEELEGGYDGVISRAFLPPEAYLDHARRLLAPGGPAVLLIGDRTWAPPAGWRVLDELRYAVPDGARRRVILKPS